MPRLQLPQRYPLLPLRLTLGGPQARAGRTGLPAQEAICLDTGRGRGGASGSQWDGEEMPNGASAKSQVLAPT